MASGFTPMTSEIKLNKLEMPIVGPVEPMVVQLDEYLRRYPDRLTTPMILMIGIGVASSMKIFAAAGMVHGDIRAGNVELVNSGFANVVRGGAGGTGESPPPDTDPAAGRWYPAAPTIATDVRAFGFLMWKLLSCKQHLEWTMVNNVRALPRPTRCPTVFWDVLEPCLNKDPTKRPTFEHLESALQALNNSRR